MASLLEALSTVDWSEPWLVTLLSLHVLTTVVIILTRRFVYFQAGLLLILGILCLFTERLNEWAATNYKSFSKEHYFDPYGFFLSLVYSLPLIINCIVIVFLWFYHIWDLLKALAVVKVKRAAQQSKESEQQGKKDK